MQYGCVTTLLFMKCNCPDKLVERFKVLKISRVIPNDVEDFCLSSKGWKF